MLGKLRSRGRRCHCALKKHSPVEETGTKPASGLGGKPFPEEVVLLGNLEREIRLKRVESRTRWNGWMRLGEQDVDGDAALPREGEVTLGAWQK